MQPAQLAELLTIEILRWQPNAHLIDNNSQTLSSCVSYLVHLCYSIRITHPTDCFNRVFGCMVLQKYFSFCPL